MKKFVKVTLSTVAVFMMTTGMAFAQEVNLKAESNAWAIFLGAGLCMGIAAFGTGLGMGRAIDSALAGVSRNPSVAPRIMTMLILGLALIESLAIYSLVVALILLFVI